MTGTPARGEVSGALLAAFLGYDPVKTMLSSLPPNVNVPPQAVAVMEQRTWFPSAIAPAFMYALRNAFYISAILVFIAAIASALRGAEVRESVRK